MKKILAFTLALAMVLATWTPTFAASKEVEALANLKLLLNTTDKEVNADLTRAVGLAMVLKALGYTQEDANAKMAENTFVDLDKAAWAKGFAKLGEDLKITNGTSVEPKKFSPNWKLNERAFVAFMLRALGYDVDAAWAKAGELAKEAMIAETVSENKLTKGEAAVIMYKALKAKVQGDEKGRTLAQKLVDEKKLDKELAVANELIAAEPEKLTVSAEADNLIEVTVKFDGTVDKASAQKPGNYRLKGRAVKGATVQEDMRTVVLKLDTAMTNKAEQELTVSNVKNAAGKVMDKQVVKFMTNDVTAPTVEKIVVTGPKNFDITFSEPVKVDVTGQELQVFVKQDKSLLSTKVGKLSNENRTVSVAMYSDFKDGKEYVIAVGNARTNSNYAVDYAGYKNPYFEETMTYTKDTTAPEVKVVKFDQREVVVEFTKPVKGAGLKAKTENFYHTFKAYTPVEVKTEDGKTIDTTESYTRAKLVFYNSTLVDKGNALPAGKVTLNVLGKVAGNEIKDNWGNVVANAAIELEVVADREAPQVTAVEAESKNIKITFNEAVITDGAKVSLLDKDGKVVEKKEGSTLTLSNDDKVINFALSKEYTGKTMTVKVETVKDASLYQNLLLDHSAEVTFTDTKFEGVKDVQYFKVTGTSPRYFLYITFKEEMDDSVLDTENYRLTRTVGGNSEEAKIQGGADFLDGNKKIVAIELTYSSEDTNTDVKFLTNVKDGAEVANAPQLKISDKIKDLAGNTVSVFDMNTPVSVTNLKDTPNFKVSEVRAVATDRVEVEFDTPIYEVDSELSHYVLKSTGVAGYVIVQVSKKNEKVLELVVAKTEAKPLLPVDAEELAVALKFETNNLAVKDVFGRTVTQINTASSLQVKDKIKPSMAKITSEGQQEDELLVFQTGKGHSKFENRLRALVALDSKQEGVAIPNTTLKKVTSKVYVVFDETIGKNSLSNTIFTVSNGWAVQSADTLGSAATHKVVVLTIEKAFDGYDKDETAKVKVVKDSLVDLTVAQVGAVRDSKGNVLEGNSTQNDTFFFAKDNLNEATDVTNNIQ